MTDEADFAQELAEAHRQAALTRRPVRPLQVGVMCCGCGQEIPAARREVLPGCCLCVECQDEADKAMGR